jgi:hypothetical protein
VKSVSNTTEKFFKQMIPTSRNQYEQKNVLLEEEKIISAPLMPFVY